MKKGALLFWLIPIAVVLYLLGSLPKNSPTDVGPASTSQPHTPVLSWVYAQHADEMGSGTIKIAAVQSLAEISFGFPYQGAQRGTLTLQDHPRRGESVSLSVPRNFSAIAPVTYRPSSTQGGFGSMKPLARQTDHPTRSSLSITRTFETSCKKQIELGWRRCFTKRERASSILTLPIYAGELTDDSSKPLPIVVWKSRCCQVDNHGEIAVTGPLHEKAALRPEWAARRLIKASLASFRTTTSGPPERFAEDPRW